MKLTNFGGATAVMEHAGRRVLFDPWLDDGIFHGAWYHYPPLKVGIPAVGRLDYIYISHIHEDHCSYGTLKELNRDAEVVLMDRTPNLVLNFLKAHGLLFKKVHLVKPQTPLKLSPELTVDMVTADPKHELNYAIDSGLVMSWDGRVVYNANDCPVYPGGLEYIKGRYGKVDLALLPYAGGSGYPACYTNLSSEEKLAEAKRIHDSGIQAFVEAVKSLRPGRAMPFADQYVIAGSRSHLNKFMAHPPGAGAVIPAMKAAGLSDALLLLNSGQTFDLDAGRKTPDEPFHAHTEAEREGYVAASLRDKKYQHELYAMAPSVPLDRLVGHARERLWKEQARQNYFPAFSYYLAVPDRKRAFRIRCDQAQVEEVPFDAPKVQPYLAMTADSTLMTLMLIGHVSWNIADAALFIDYERVPNRYDPKLQAFINYIRV